MNVRLTAYIQYNKTVAAGDQKNEVSILSRKLRERYTKLIA